MKNLRYDIPNGWQFLQLEKIAAPFKGSIRIGPFGSALKKHEYGSTDIRVLGIEDVLPNELVSDRVKYIPRRKYEELTQYTVEVGDILVTNMGTVGRVCCVPEGMETSIISSHLIKVTLDNTKAYAPYISRALNDFSVVKRQIEAKCHGAIMAGFNSSLLKSLYIPLPPVDEQVRIASMLDKADSIRRKRQQAIDLTNQLLRSVFLDMFGDPATNPKGWPIDGLGEHLSFVTSGSRGWAKYYSDTGALFIRSLDVQMNELAFEDAAFVMPPDNAEAKRTLVYKGDVLLTITGSRIGRVSPVRNDLGRAHISQHVAIIRPKKTIISEYVAMFLSDANGGQKQIKESSYGQTKPGLNLDQIKNFQVPIPPIDLQEKYLKISNRIRGFGSNLDKSIDELEKLEKSLNINAFRGNLSNQAEAA